MLSSAWKVRPPPHSIFAAYLRRLVAEQPASFDDENSSRASIHLDQYRHTDFGIMRVASGILNHPGVNWHRSSTTLILERMGEVMLGPM